MLNKEVVEALAAQINEATKILQEAIKQLAEQEKPGQIKKCWLDKRILEHGWKHNHTTQRDISRIAIELCQQITNRIYSVDISKGTKERQAGFNTCRTELQDILTDLSGRRYWVVTEPGHSHHIETTLPTEKAKVECTDCKADITAGGFTCPSLAAGNYCEDCFIKVAEQKLKPKQGTDNFNRNNLGKWS